MKKIMLFISITIAIYSCKKENNTTKNDIAGRFSLSRVENLKSAKTGSSDDSASFDLDTLKSSRTYYFVLTNVGQKDISDIVISTDNQNFNVTPSKINDLPGKTNNDNLGLTQIISLDVTHGYRINGVGYAKLLSLGSNLCNINITGKTNDGTKNIDVSLNAKVKVYAKIMDISLYFDTVEVDLTKPEGSFSCQSTGYSPTMFLYYYEDQVPVIIKNTGNTEIGLTLSYQKVTNVVSYIPIQSSILNPDDTLRLMLPYSSDKSITYIKLDSQGTICDPNRICLGDDGFGYLAIFYK